MPTLGEKYGANLPEKWVQVSDSGEVTSTDGAEAYTQKLRTIHQEHTEERFALCHQIKEDGLLTNLDSFDANGGELFELNDPKYKGKGLLEILTIECPPLNAAFNAAPDLRELVYLNVHDGLGAQGVDANVIFMTTDRNAGTKIKFIHGVVTVITPDGREATCSLFEGGGIMIEPPPPIETPEPLPPIE
tara:strand:- start:320 stop:886 length:567 start_codon:yes stop_codon:yes gene_type:complete